MRASASKKSRERLNTVTEKTATVAARIADELASCGVKLVASLPDNWLMDVIKTIEHDDRFTHVPVNREESAIGLCSGAYMGAMGSAALMGASGFMTVIYALTKINYTYEIPLFLMATLRGAVGDHHKHHISNGLYLRPVLDAISMPGFMAKAPSPMNAQIFRSGWASAKPEANMVDRLIEASR